MPYSTKFLDQGRGVLHVGTGDVTGAEIIDGLVLELDHAATLRYSIVDLSSSETVTAGWQDLLKMSEADGALAREATRLMVAFVARSELQRFLIRTWEAMAAAPGWKVRVFRNRTEALAWLRESLAVSDPPIALPAALEAEDQEEKTTGSAGLPS